MMSHWHPEKVHVNIADSNTGTRKRLIKVTRKNCYRFSLSISTVSISM